MDRFHLMSVYVAVAEAESFAGGARKLGMSPPAVTRAIAALEARLGTRLLTRTTRYVRATDAGLRYLEQARRVIADADAADEAAAGVHAEPRGQLAVTAPMLFGHMYVLPCMLEHLRRFPEISITALFLDRVVNLIEEGMDVGVRIGELPDSSMRAIRVGGVSRVVCAAPAYLRAHGTPKVPADLAKHTVIAANAVSPSNEWKFSKDRKPLRVKVHPRLTVSNNEAAVAAAVQGFGITRLMSYQIAPFLASGELRTVLGQYAPPSLPIHVLHQEGRQASAKIRTFVDFLVESLRTNKALR